MIDTSALVAVLDQEPEAERIVRSLASAQGGPVPNGSTPRMKSSGTNFDGHRVLSLYTNAVDRERGIARSRPHAVASKHLPAKGHTDIGPGERWLRTRHDVCTSSVVSASSQAGGTIPNCRLRRVRSRRELCGRQAFAA
jgi:hypothetical protein